MGRGEERKVAKLAGNGMKGRESNESSMVGAEVVCDEVIVEFRAPAFSHTFFSSPFEVLPNVEFWRNRYSAHVCMCALFLSVGACQFYQVN